ncbi:transposase, partial [Parabacteroides johnsonii]|uniref:transposase n=1 Tax=Parabacteroides johnsonii TaxID=387661 RepID=UPI00165256A4
VYSCRKIEKLLYRDIYYIWLSGYQKPDFATINRFRNRVKNEIGLLTSEEGIKERGRRCIEPEAVFGQMKSNMAYRRFRHMGKDKVLMDFTFFAIAFNIKKLCSMMRKVDKKGRKTSSYGKFVIIFICYMHKLEICQDKFEKMTA